MLIQIQRCGPVKVPLPRYQTQGAAGVDLHLATPESVILGAGGCRQLVPTGIRVSIPQGFEGQVRPRSGRSAREGLSVINSPGTIDSDYRGEILVCLINLDPATPIVLKPLDRIAQLVVCPIAVVEWLEVEELGITERGIGGHGSTGV